MGVADKINTAQKINAYNNDPQRIALKRTMAQNEIKRNKEHVLKMAALGYDVDFMTGLGEDGETSFHWSYDTKEYMQQCNYYYDNSEKNKVLDNHRKEMIDKYGVSRKQYLSIESNGFYELGKEHVNQEKSLSFSKYINYLIDNVLNNPSEHTAIITIVTNFIIDNTGIEKVMSGNFIRAFESLYLFHINPDGINLLLSRDEKYSSDILEHNPVIKSYVNTDFEKFSQILSQYIDIDSEDKALYFSYTLLMKLSVTVLGEQFIERYPTITSQDSFDDVISKFVINEDGALALCSLLTYYLMYSQRISHTNYLVAYKIIYPKLEYAVNNNSLMQYQKKLLGEFNTIDDNHEESIAKTDSMSGTEFEEFVFNLFTQMGYNCQLTKATGDQGIDIIAKKNDSNVGIQAKCYSNTVGNKAIQEAVAGKNFYNLDKVMVVTNNYYTSSAIELAQANDVTLWNRNDIEKRLKQIKELSLL